MTMINVCVDSCWAFVVKSSLEQLLIDLAKYNCGLFIPLKAVSPDVSSGATVVSFDSCQEFSSLRTVQIQLRRTENAPGSEQRHPNMEARFRRDGTE